MLRNISKVVNIFFIHVSFVRARTQKIEGYIHFPNESGRVQCCRKFRVASDWSQKNVQECLRYSKTFSKFNKVTRKLEHSKVRSLGINHIWSMDVAFMEKLANYNGGYRYHLINVDVLSRSVRVQPTNQNLRQLSKKLSTRCLPRSPIGFP